MLTEQFDKPNEPGDGSNTLKSDTSEQQETSVPILPRDRADSTIMEDDSSFIPSTPKSPLLSSSNSYSLTPYSSNGGESEDNCLFSDSDGVSLNSLDTPWNKQVHEKKTDTKKEATPGKRRLSNKSRNLDGTPSPKPKRRIRRKSNKGEESEKSYRSNRHIDQVTGSGYTLAPATGKIFRNLLILEDSLREQVIQQRALRRKYLTFLFVLCSLIAIIGHRLYFSSDALSATIRVVLQFTLLALLVTLMLYHLSGEYQKTIVLPRKFLSSTNKGLRQLNIRLVKIKTPFLDGITDTIRELVLYSVTYCLSFLHYMNPSTKGNPNSKLELLLVSLQLRSQPRTGISDVKLVLNARVFNLDVREGWELYRSEFWAQEGVRRRQLIIASLKKPHDERLDRSQLLRKDKKERRERRKSSIMSATPSKIGTPVNITNNEDNEYFSSNS